MTFWHSLTHKQVVLEEPRGLSRSECGGWGFYGSGFLPLSVPLEFALQSSVSLRRRAFKTRSLALLSALAKNSDQGKTANRS